MDLTEDLLHKLSDYICPVHGEDMHFKIDAMAGKIDTYCCELCKDKSRR